MTDKSGLGAAIFIFVTVVLDVMAGTMAFPVFPSLIKTVSPGSASHIAELFGALATLFAVMQFAAAPVQGALSDSFGRRPIILASCFGLGVDSVVMALAPDLAWLFAARLVSGILAGSMTAVSAYLADTTAPEKRATVFGYFFAAVGLGQAIGPSLGGWLATYGIRAPFWAAAGMSLLSGLYGLFVLPESLPKERRSAFGAHSFNPLATVFALWRTYPRLVSWVLVMLLLALGVSGINVIFVLYTGYRYAWTPRDIGLLLTSYGVGTIIVQAGLVPLVIRWLGDRRTMLAGFVLQAAAVIGCGLARNGVEFCIAFVVLCCGAVGGPAQSAIVSRLVDASDQGKLSGANRSIYNLSFMIGPALFTYIYAEAVELGGKPFSGAPFLVAGLLIALAGVFTARIAPKETVHAEHKS
jgi:DHA1 family tetracycline resistance protein-like MFS transporter